MNYLLLFAAVLGLSVQYVLGGSYDRRLYRPDPFVYCLCLSSAVCLCFVVYNRFAFACNRSTVLFGLAYGACYLTAFVSQLLCVRFGGVALTSLAVSYSLVLPALYGLAAYGEQPTPMFYPALALLLVSLFLIRFPAKRRSREEQTPAHRPVLWTLLAVVCFAANGLCSVLQTEQQRQNDGLYKAELMIVAMAVVFAVSAVAVLFTREKRPAVWKAAALKGGLCGVSNAAVNLIIMILVSRMSVSMIFPVVSGGSVALTYLASRLFFGESLSARQNGGFLAGVVAVVLFNIR